MRNITTHSNGGTGIIMAFGSGNLAYNILSYNNGGTGVWLDSDGIQLYNATVYNNGGPGVCVDGEGITIGNVIALSNSGGQIVNCNSSNNSFTSSNNITSGSASDYFIDATASNFSLNAGSSAREAGIDVGLPFSGAAPDIGACEYGSNQTCPPGESSS